MKVISLGSNTRAIELDPGKDHIGSVSIKQLQNKNVSKEAIDIVEKYLGKKTKVEEAYSGEGPEGKVVER